MRVSWDWLGEWVEDRATPLTLAERLTSAGLEAAHIFPAGPPLSDKRVVIGHILETTSLDGGAGLKRCRVDIGSRNVIVVCAAESAIVGHKVVYAAPGAKLLQGSVISKTVHGITSRGMLCSCADLALEEQSDDIMILDSDAAVGKSAARHLGLNDFVLELEITPNRGDCLSMRGVARETAALTLGTLTPPSTRAVRARSDTQLPVELRAPHGCSRYVGRAVCGVDVNAHTPDWMTERLRRCGVRSRNVVVDITNYVMLELGQPMHAFDMDKLVGGIVVRMAHPRERLHLLDDTHVTLGREYVVIADHERAVALGGIMGGQDTAISATTRNIYFEAAFFPPAAILGKARTIGRQTDAAQRFERGVDPTMQRHAMERATALLVSIAGGAPGPVTDESVRGSLPKPPRINFYLDDVLRLLGAEVAEDDARPMLERLGMKVSPRRNYWSVTPPPWRTDLRGPHDLVEEIGRMCGLDQIPVRPPEAPALLGAHPETRTDLAAVQHCLTERGYHEAMTYSFVDTDTQRRLSGDAPDIALRNPIADNMAVMRRSLWPGLMGAMRTNLNRQHERVRLFEVGRVFLPGHGAAARSEVQRIAAVASGAVLPRQWGAAPREVDFYDMKGDVEALLGGAARTIKFHPDPHPALHPGRCARISLSGRTVGHLGQLHPHHHKALDIDQPVYLFELDWSALAHTAVPRYATVSRYPAIRRDLAVVVREDVEAWDVRAAVHVAAGPLLTALEFFDIYRGEGIPAEHKSLAFGLTFQSQSGSLTAERVDAVIERVKEALQRLLRAHIRASA